MTPATDPDAFAVPLDPGAVTALHYAAAAPAVGATFICAHGAGSHQRHASITALAHGLAARGLDVVTFNFPYTEAGRKLPDRAPVLEACYTAVVRATRERVASARAHLFIGGRSMGGRMATHIAAADADPVELLEFADHLQLRQAAPGRTQVHVDDSDGCVDFPALLARLERLDYRGRCSIEYFDLPDQGWTLDDPRGWARDLLARLHAVGA